MFLMTYFFPLRCTHKWIKYLAWRESSSTQNTLGQLIKRHVIKFLIENLLK